MFRVSTKVVLNAKELKLFEKYFTGNDKLLLTEDGLLNFSKKILVPNKKLFKGIPTIFSGSFLKGILKEKKHCSEVEVFFKPYFGDVIATVPKDNPTEEWDKEFQDFSARLVPGGELKFPGRENLKPVKHSALQYLLMLSDYSILFNGEVAYAYGFLKTFIARFPNPFRGLKGSASRHSFKELKRFKSSNLLWKQEENILFVFNGAIFFQELSQEEETISFPELPKEGWIKVNPSALLKALDETYQWRAPYKISLSDGKLKIETQDAGNVLKAEVPYYGRAEAKEISLSSGFPEYLKIFKKIPLIEINFAEDYVFLKTSQLEAVIQLEETKELQPFYAEAYSQSEEV